MNLGPQKPNVICIIGMHRSGTSMVARLLNLCGLYLGPESQLVGPDPGNPLGHFEHIGFHEIDEALLSHFGGSWNDPPRFREGWEHDSPGPIVQNAKVLLETFCGRSPWGWKDPRTTILLPFWKSLLPDLRFVICVRSPLEVARSLEKRDGISIGAGVHLWNRYMAAAVHDTDGWPRIFTFYEDYFNNAFGEITRLVDFCELEQPRDFPRLREAISNELRHHASETLELLNEETIPTEQKLFYICLRALAYQRFVSGMLEGCLENRYSKNIGRLLQLIEEFRDEEKIAQLEVAVAEMEQKLSSARLVLQETLKGKEHDIKKFEQQALQMERQVRELEQRNAELQAFSDAVRQTVAYRFYRKFIKPFGSRSQ